MSDPDTDSMPLDPHVHRRKRVQFDPTINLGHIMTFVASLCVVAAAYFDLRERLAVNEVLMKSVANEVQAEKVRNAETLREMRDDVREVRRGVEDLLRNNIRKP